MKLRCKSQDSREEEIRDLACKTARQVLQTVKSHSLKLDSNVELAYYLQVLNRHVAMSMYIHRELKGLN